MSSKEFVETARAMEKRAGIRVFEDVIVISRAGFDDELIAWKDFDSIADVEVRPPFCVVVPAELSGYEKENLSALYSEYV